jgi:FkbM family methyltransferase
MSPHWSGIGDAARRARRRVQGLAGRDHGARLEMHCPTERIGGEYGGYVMSSVGITDRSVVYSLGVGEDISFDLGLIDRLSATVHAFDPTPRAAEWLSQQALPDRFVFHAYGIAARDGAATFRAPANPTNISHVLVEAGSSGGPQWPIRRLSSVMAELGHDRIDLLKMDIEGAEYEVIRDLVESGLDVGQLLVEFHHRIHKLGVERTRVALALLRGSGFRIFYVSDNGTAVSLLRQGQ